MIVMSSFTSAPSVSASAVIRRLPALVVRLSLVVRVRSTPSSASRVSPLVMPNALLVSVTTTSVPASSFNMPDRFVVSAAAKESISIVPVVANVRFVAVIRSISVSVTVMPTPVAWASLIPASLFSVMSTSCPCNEVVISKSVEFKFTSPAVVPALTVPTVIIPPVEVSVMSFASASVVDATSVATMSPVVEVTEMEPFAASTSVSVIPSASVIVMSPVPLVLRSALATVVSIAPAVPTPVTALITSRPLAATTSTVASPPSTIPPEALARVTAVAELFVVNRPPSVTASSASSVIVPLPASISVSSVMVSAPPEPDASPFESAVTETFPEVEVTSPDDAKITSLSASRSIAPDAVVMPSFTLMSEVAPVTAIVTVPAPVTEIALSPAET